MPHSQKIGIRADDVSTDVRQAIKLLPQIGAECLELSAANPQVAPRELTDSGRRHLAHLVRQRGADLSAIAAPGGGLTDPTRVDAAIAATTDTLRMAADMGVPVVTQDVGELAGLDAERQAETIQVLRVLAEQAERFGTVFAVRSRLASPAAWEGMIKTVGSPLVRASVDPASLIMTGVDPIEAVAALGEDVAFAYARDGVRGSAEQRGYETPLGQGAVAFDAYLAALAAGGYHGTLLLRRTGAALPAAELKAARDRLIRLLG